MDKVIFFCETKDSHVIESYVRALDELKNDKIKILMNNQGLYFIDINTIFHKEYFDTYICNEEIQIDVDHTSFLNCLKTVDGSTVLNIFIKKNDTKNLRIIQRRNNTIQRDMIKINLENNLLKKRIRKLI